jgi:amino acid adenylation domain-containing protein
VSARISELLHESVVRNASVSPHRPAVVGGDRVLSYGELDTRSNQVARLLADECGVSRGDRVGLYLEKSVEAIIAIYGVLKCGAAYVPLDPLAPVERLGYIARDCGLSCLLTGAEKAKSWDALRNAGAPIDTFVVLNSHNSFTAEEAAIKPARILGCGELDRKAETPHNAELTGDDLAYILYTSGSTGRPKGVMLSHHNGLAFVDWAADEFALEPDDRLSSHAPLHFDLSIFDVFAASRAGAAMVLLPRTLSMFPVELARFIDETHISIWYSVPSILSMLVQRGGLAPGDLPGLRTVLFAGEIFPTKYLRALMSCLPHARFSNLYGPTETNVCTWYDVPPLDGGRVDPIPIGKPIRGDRAFVVTDEGGLAPRGEVGTLHIAGHTVMMGYWGDEERTRSKLVPGVPGCEPGERAYNTGDLVREDEAGDFIFLGRRDHQIKSRGYRIELGEVEAALLAHPNVVECAVLAVPDELITNRLSAVVVTQAGLDRRELARFCSKRVPTYMVPESFSVRETLPKTSTGKIDRQALEREVAAQSA